MKNNVNIVDYKKNESLNVSLFCLFMLKKPLSKKDVVASIAQKSGSSKVDAEKFLNAFKEVVVSSVSKNEGINLIGFLSFKIVKRAARVSINPKTKAKMNVPAKNVVKVTVGQELKNAVK